MAQSRKSLQSRKRRQERIRQEKHARQVEEAVERAIGSTFDEERVMRLAARLQGTEGLPDAAAVEAFLDEAGPEELDARLGALPPDPVEEAQELAFQAMDAETQEEAQALLERALALDPACLDALAMKASFDAEKAGDAAQAVAALVAAEEARRGEAFFRERHGRMWDHADTRPYLRTLAGLAELLERAERPGEAVPVYQRLLLLDATDAPGNRFGLVRACLAANRLKELRIFLAQAMRDEPQAAFAWAEVLERIRSEALTGARQALLRARKLNPWVEDFLTGKRRVPRQAPFTAAPGSPEEALQVLEVVGAAWTEDRQAMAWLLRGGKVSGESSPA